MTDPGPISPGPGGVGVQLAVYVQPRASRTECTGLHDGAIRIRLAAPPVEGAANDALVRFLADRIGVPRGSIRVVRGMSGRRKVVVVDGVTVAQVAKALDVALD